MRKQIKVLGFRMKTKGKRNVDNIHKGVFPLPINSNVSQKTDTPQYK